MADIEAVRTAHGTLDGTDPDVVTLTGGFDLVEVLNRGDVGLWATDDGTAPEVGGDGSEFVPAGTAVLLNPPANNPVVVGLLGDGNDYSVSGVRG